MSDSNEGIVVNIDLLDKDIYNIIFEHIQPSFEIEGMNPAEMYTQCQNLSTRFVRMRQEGVSLTDMEKNYVFVITLGCLSASWACLRSECEHGIQLKDCALCEETIRKGLEEVNG